MIRLLGTIGNNILVRPEACSVVKRLASDLQTRLFLTKSLMKCCFLWCPIILSSLMQNPLFFPVSLLQSTHHIVNSSHDLLITRSCYHTVLVNSSYGQLITSISPQADTQDKIDLAFSS